MNKFKVGDRVRIKKEHTDNWAPVMFGLVGRTGEIVRVVRDKITGEVNHYVVLVDGCNDWAYFPDSLEPVEESQKHTEDCKVNVCGVTISGDTESVKKFLLDMVVQCAKAEDIYKIQKLNNLAKDSGEFFKTLYGEFERLENGI